LTLRRMETPRAAASELPSDVFITSAGLVWGCAYVTDSLPFTMI
jgi:hypothetical protein